jgi:hypothetical protein
MLIKCHEHLQPLVKSNNIFANQDIFYQDYNLDIFEQIANTSESTKMFVKRELLIFKRYQLDVKDFKCLFQWWQNHETMFFIARILT